MAGVDDQWNGYQGSYAGTSAYAATPAYGAAPWSATHPAASAVAVPPPAKPAWSMYVFAAGCIAMLVALLLVVAQVPATAFYDADAEGVRTKNTSRDPLKISASIDSNMKFIGQNTDDKPGHYNYYLASVNDSEEAIPAMAGAVIAMNGDVKSIDANLGEVLATTQAMSADMQAMAATAGHTATTEDGLVKDIGALSGSMNSLYVATKQLTVKMARVQKQAKGIADHGTSKSLAVTRELTKALPEKVPAPTTSLDPDRTVAGGGVRGIATTPDGTPMPTFQEGML